MTEDEAGPRSNTIHEIGQALDELSVAELQARIALLHSEVRRLEAAVTSKQGARDAASAFFAKQAE